MCYGPVIVCDNDSDIAKITKLHALHYISSEPKYLFENCPCFVVYTRVLTNVHTKYTCISVDLFYDDEKQSIPGGVLISVHERTAR